MKRPRPNKSLKLNLALAWMAFVAVALMACKHEESHEAHRLAITEATFSQLRGFRAEPKFHEDLPAFYPGAPNENIRERCELKLNGLLDRLIEGLPKNPTRNYVLKEFRSTLNLFEVEDSEERDRIALYLERIMVIVGVESSDGLLNKWRYGVDPSGI